MELKDKVYLLNEQNRLKKDLYVVVAITHTTTGKIYKVQTKNEDDIIIKLLVREEDMVSHEDVTCLTLEQVQNMLNIKNLIII